MLIEEEVSSLKTLRASNRDYIFSYTQRCEIVTLVLIVKSYKRAKLVCIIRENNYYGLYVIDLGIRVWKSSQVHSFRSATCSNIKRPNISKPRCHSLYRPSMAAIRNWHMVESVFNPLQEVKLGYRRSNIMIRFGIQL